MKKVGYAAFGQTMMQSCKVPSLRPLLASNTKRFNSSKSFFSFTPTAEISHQQSLEQSMAEMAAAVPFPPVIESSQRIFKDMVKPEHVCDLTYKPSTEDILVTCLAEKSPLTGDPQYRVVSKSSVNESHLMFASIAIPWIESFRSNIIELAELPRTRNEMRYNNIKEEQVISNALSNNSLETNLDIDQLYKALQECAISIENVTKYILSHPEGRLKNGPILQYVSRNVDRLNHSTMKDFVSFLLENLSQNTTLDRVEHFDRFVSDFLLPTNPSLLQELDPLSLEKLAYFTSFSSNLSASRRALTLLVEKYKIAPSKPTVELFLARYCKNAKNSSKEATLLDLSFMKPVLFHYGVSTDFVKFLLRCVTESIQDLSHLVTFAFSTSRPALVESGADIINKLREIQSKSKDSKVAKGVQLTQLVKFLKEAGTIPDSELKSTIQQAYKVLKIESNIVNEI